MEEYEDNDPQGELFSDIWQQDKINSSHSSPQGSSETKKHARMFDKCVLCVLIVIIIVTVSYVVGYQRGKITIQDQTEQESSFLVPVDPEPVALETRTVDTPTPVYQSSAESSEMGTGAGVYGQNVITDMPALPESTESAEVVPELPTDGWTVQLVTYSSLDMAQEEMDRLTKDGYAPFLIPSGKYQQVCMNQFATQKDAQKMLDTVKKNRRYNDAFVRKIKR